MPAVEIHPLWQSRQYFGSFNWPVTIFVCECTSLTFARTVAANLWQRCSIGESFIYSFFFTPHPAKYQSSNGGDAMVAPPLAIERQMTRDDILPSGRGITLFQQFAEQLSGFLRQLFTEAVTYSINGKTISLVNRTKDLGILLSSSLIWDDHYNSILSKAYKILGLIRRTFSTNSIFVKKKLYISLIRAQLLYCSQVWRPYKIKDILLLERAQRRATKYILNDFYSSYKSRLIKLNLLPLMYIFEINDIMFFIKSYKSSSTHFNIRDYIKICNNNTRSGTFTKMIHQRSSSNIFHNSYFCRLPRLWNSLPPIDLSSPVNTIKFKLLHFLWNHFVENFIDNLPCTFHFYCPCSKCLATVRPSLFTFCDN